MYSYNKYSQCQIKVSCRTYRFNNFAQLTILLKAHVYKLQIFKQLTYKQALFGANHQESSTHLIIKKSDLDLVATTNNHAEALLVALLIKLQLNTLALNHLGLVYSGATIEDGKTKYTYWFTIADQPVDSYNNIDPSVNLNINSL